METVRFIPAGAGNSINWERLITATAVYPRWRGELPHALYSVQA